MLDDTDTVVAALSVSVPAYRFTPDLREWLVGAVKTTGDRISEDLARAGRPDVHASAPPPARGRLLPMSTRPEQG